MPDDTNRGLDEFLKYPLVDAIRHRRSRRFSLGAEIPGGGLKYKSNQSPVGLSNLEEAILATSAAGFSGFALGDLAYDGGVIPEGGGGNVMAALTGRVAASADAVHSTSLFVINDEATYVLKRPQDLSLDDYNALSELSTAGRYEEVYEKMRIKIRDGRTSIPREVPHMFPFNKWDTNLPGTTYFLPVCDLTSMYINIVLSGLDGQMGLFFVDDRNSYRPAGLEKFGKSNGGSLHDDPKDRRIVPINYLETTIVEFMLAEQAFMNHNLSLVEQAMGLGGWTHFATADEVSWMEALGFTMGSQTVSQILRAGRFKRLAIKLLSKNFKVPHPLGLTVAGEDVLKSYCPPYFKNMEEAVLAFLDFKRKNAFKPELKPEYGGTWKNPEEVQEKIPDFTDETIEATIAYCTYIYDTYGRFPAYFGPYRNTLAHQAHHLDLEFYDKFYRPGAYTSAQAQHMERWH